MNPLPLDFDPRAIVDAREALRWYAKRSISAANRLVLELDRAFERIVEAPEQWPPHSHGTRFFRLRRFPFYVVYRQLNQRIQVIAVAHGRRKPGYWRKRLR